MKNDFYPPKIVGNFRVGVNVEVEGVSLPSLPCLPVLGCSGDYEELRLANVAAQVAAKLRGDFKPNVEWWSRKRLNVELARWFEQANEIYGELMSDKRLEDLRSCGNFLQFDKIFSAASGKGRLRLTNANFCRVRLCPICQWRRGLRFGVQMRSVLDVLSREKPTLRFILATFTLRNCELEDLSAEVDRLNGALKKFFRQFPARSLVEGYVRCLEVSLNVKERNAHPHYHCLIAVDPSYFKGGKFLRQEGWVKLWRESAGVDYDPSVDVRMVRRDEQGRLFNELFKSFKYLVKGSVTIERLACADTATRALFLKWLTESLRRRRFVGFTGVFAAVRRRLKLADVEDLRSDDESELIGDEEVIGSVRFKFDTSTFAAGVYVENGSTLVEKKLRKKAKIESKE